LRIAVDLINNLIKIRLKLKKIMKAKFTGKCVECEDVIKAGKEILKNSKDQWVHKACCDLEEELP
jgi:hypothetical protein